MRKPGGAPVRVGSLFEVYRKRLRAPQGSVVAAAVEVVEDVVGVALNPKMCEYSPITRILHIKASGPLKSEISLRKEEILTHLKGRLGEKSAPTQLL